MTVVEEGTQVVIAITGSEEINFNKAWGRFWFKGENTIIEDAFTGHQYEEPTATLEGDAGVIGDEAAVRAYLSTFVGL